MEWGNLPACKVLLERRVFLPSGCIRVYEHPIGIATFNRSGERIALRYGSQYEKPDKASRSAYSSSIVSRIRSRINECSSTYFLVMNNSSIKNRNSFFDRP